jgi:hypothetical protein
MPPVAVHVPAEGHETAYSSFWPAGEAVGWTVQVLPSHCSASAAPPALPTAVH